MEQKGQLAPVILAVGHDEHLMETRRLVLVSAAYHVFTASDHDGLAWMKIPKIDLAIICHSVDWDQTVRIVSCLRAIHPETPVLRLTQDVDDAPSPCDDVLVSATGPYRLLHKVQELLDSRS